VVQFRTGRVEEVLSSRRGLQRVVVDGEPAYALTEIVGELTVGDPVVVNTTAVSLGLGTGGHHVVHWNLNRTELAIPGPGHLMKARYLSEQIDTGAWDEYSAPGPDDPPPEVPDLGGIPVAVCSLHSHVGVVAAAVRSRLGSARVGYVMTDAASLPLAMSNLVAELRDRGLLDLSVSTGQAFGGDLEALTPASGVEACMDRGMDAVIMAMGPGHAGTGAALGFTGLEVVGLVDLLNGLGARATPVVRWSDTDPRRRHQGLSHHSRTILTLLARPFEVPVPPTDRGRELARELTGIETRGRAVEVAMADPVGVLEDHGVTIRSMGRPLANDRGAIETLAAVGTWVGDRLEVATGRVGGSGSLGQQ